jgi:hypothetical protein
VKEASVATADGGIGLLPASRADQSIWIYAALSLCFALQIELAFNRPVHWDEFLHLGEAHAFAQGHLHEVFQVLYARAFFWLPLLPLDSIDQIRVARLFMLGFEAFTTFAIYRMASLFTPRIPAALAALGYVGCGYVFDHGFSFRADPMAAAFLMAALWIMLVSRLKAGAILGASLLVALGVMSTIKIVLYAPAFAGFAWLRWKEAEDGREMITRLFALAATAILLTCAILAATMLLLPPEETVSASKTISASANTVFSEGFFPRWNDALLAALFAPLTAALILATPFALRRSPLALDRRLALLGLFLPLISILIYRNSFPYFYAYILAPVMVAAAVAIETLAKKISVPILAAALLVGAVATSATTSREVLTAQRDVIAAATEIFPRPVAYFDSPGMMVDYPKANFFMSSWGVMKYRAGAEPTFLEVMSRETVPLLITNREPLIRNQNGPGPAPELLPQDAAALRQGFVHHWGPIWVAGQRFSPAQTAEQFVVHAPGTYTLEGAAARIDGQEITPGSTVQLARGTHRFVRSKPGEVVLRWGAHLVKPTRPFQDVPLFKER